MVATTDTDIEKDRFYRLEIEDPPGGAIGPGSDIVIEGTQRSGWRVRRADKTELAFYDYPDWTITDALERYRDGLTEKQGISQEP